LGSKLEIGMAARELILFAAVALAALRQAARLLIGWCRSSESPVCLNEKATRSAASALSAV
jgi:hypothetical protein